MECRKIAGFEEFVAWVAKFHTDEEKTHNNNISSVRTFMQMFAGSDRPLSMRLLTSPDQIIKYMDLIKEQKHYVPKTRLQKIEALKKAIKWLKACSYRMDLPYVSGSDRDNLDCILGMLNKECNDLRPYAKADEGRCSLMSSHIAKNAFLSKEKFSELGDKLLKQLDKQHRNIADFKQLSLRKDAIKEATMAYMRTLITSLFVLVPTQRAKVITLMELDDITYIPNGASVNLAMEKNSYRRLHIRDVVGRHMAIPRSVSQYLQLWTQRYRRNLVVDESIMAVWIDRKGRELASQTTSNIVRSVCSKLSGADLTPLSLRRLRTTYFVRAVQETMGNVAAADYIAQYAAEVGQTTEILHKFYLIKDPADQVAASKQMADMSNEIIFGRKELLPEGKLQAFKPRSMVRVEVARRKREDEMKDLIDFPLLETTKADIGNIPKVKDVEKEKKEKKKVVCDTGVKKSISTFFQARKAIEKAQVQSPIQQAIIDLTTVDNRWKHDHDFRPSVRMIRFSFSEDMRSRILSGQWLSDEETSGAIALIKRQFPQIGGLENTLVLKHTEIVTKAQRCDNIYIVHEADAHWVCAKYTCRRNVFTIYDSMQGTIVNQEHERAA